MEEEEEEEKRKEEKKKEEDHRYGTMNSMDTCLGLYGTTKFEYGNWVWYSKDTCLGLYGTC